VRLNPVATELTTAATDAALGALCLWIVWWLSDARAGWAQAIWMAVFALMAVASILGAVAHGLELSDRARWRLWQPLYLSLGLMIALLVVAVVVFIRWFFRWRNLRRVLFALACLATLVVLFYAEENWRGKRAWEQCKRDLEAALVHLAKLLGPAGRLRLGDGACGERLADGEH
jgi:hypothetical protein